MKLNTNKEAFFQYACHSFPARLIFFPEDVGSTFLYNVDYLVIYTDVSHNTRESNIHVLVCFDGKPFSLLSVHLQVNKKVSEALQATREEYYDKL